MESLFIDDREADLIAAYRAQMLPHKVKRLEVGDLVAGNAVIERKSANDFVASMKDQRLIKQCERMLENYEKVFIIIHGNLAQTITAMYQNAMLGMLASIGARTTISVFQVNTIDECAYLSYKLLEKATDGKPFNFEAIRAARRTDERLAVLCLVQGISINKAKALLEAFNGSLPAIWAASPEALQQAQGIGKKQAERIQEFAKLITGGL